MTYSITHSNYLLVHYITVYIAIWSRLVGFAFSQVIKDYVIEKYYMIMISHEKLVGWCIHACMQHHVHPIQQHLYTFRSMHAYWLRILGMYVQSQHLHLDNTQKWYHLYQLLASTDAWYSSCLILQDAYASRKRVQVVSTLVPSQYQKWQWVSQNERSLSS